MLEINGLFFNVKVLINCGVIFLDLYILKIKLLKICKGKIGMIEKEKINLKLGSF